MPKAPGPSISGFVLTNRIYILPFTGLLHLNRMSLDHKPIYTKSYSVLFPLPSPLPLPLLVGKVAGRIQTPRNEKISPTFEI
jgi:hypothetical protein